MMCVLHLCNNNVTDFLFLSSYWLCRFVPFTLSRTQASDFSSPEELGKHLKMLAADEEAYEAYFKWREDPEEEKRFEQVC